MTYENRTSEEWKDILKKKYRNLFELVNGLVPELWTPLEFAISIQKILNIKNCTLPFAGILLGAPSSLKTVIVELFRTSKNSYYTDSFSVRSLVSHYAGLKEEQLKKIDMLPKLKNKFFLCSELSPMFTKKEEDLKETIGIITRLLDGQGLVTNTGACGQRGYEGEHMFVWMGAAVDIPYRVHKLMGSLGPKLYFLRLDKRQKTEDELLSDMDKDDFVSKIKKIRKSLTEYLDYFDNCPFAEKDFELTNKTKEEKIIKIQWDNDIDEEYARRVIIRIARLLGHLRAVVTTWTQDIAGIEFSYPTITIEAPQRAITQLRNLARGHALSQGRTFISIQDLPLLIKVVLSTASLDKVNIFDLLIAHKGTLTTSTITGSLNTDHKVAHRIMTELKAVGLVDYNHTQSHTEEKQIKLKEEFNWFLTDEFKELREGFIPTDNSEFIKEYCRKYKIDLGQSLPPCDTIPKEERSIENYTYNCYQCIKFSNGSSVYGTNSLTDYQRHWITSGHKGPCRPSKVDLNHHGWTAQGKPWEV